MTLGLAACAPGEQTATPAPPPRIVFEQTEYSFGRVEQGATAAHEFRFSNDGGMNLTVDKVRVGCDCPADLNADRFIPPGGAGRIRLTCTTQNAFGVQRRTATVYSNDPQQPVVVLALLGAVDAEVAVEPSPLYVGRVRRGQRALRGATVRSEGGSAVDLIVAADAPFTVVRAPAAGDATVRFDIVIKRDARAGPIDQQLRVQRPSGEVLLEVPVIGEVSPDDASAAAPVAP